jgi:hypothetical protein
MHSKVISNLFSIFLALLCSGCQSNSSVESVIEHEMQEIKGRDNDQSSFSVYRVKVPDSWIRRDPLPDESLVDTTKPLSEFIILDSEGVIRIWIHNFPSERVDQRISPLSQKERWQKQFNQIFPNETDTVPQAFNGYSGLLFCGTGVLNDAKKTVYAWALQIAAEHYQTLSQPNSKEEAVRFKQMRADITIKAEGPSSAMKKHTEMIYAFARSFELIEEIPTPW